MAKAVVAALRDAGSTRGPVAARNACTGDGVGRPVWGTPGGRAWLQPAAVLVNATPVGMSGGPAADSLPVEPRWWTPPRPCSTWSRCRR
jgi:shikimate dehydrogenase